MPRSGGVAVVVAVVLAWVAGIVGNLLPCNAVTVAMGGGMLLLALVGMLDDRWNLTPPQRLLAQLVAAEFLLLAGLQMKSLQLPGLILPLPLAAALLLTLLYILWMTNLYNFMDGMDGFAGGMSLIGFAALALLGWRAGNSDFALLALTVGAASGGFLLFNFPPARIFMGDAGAPTLGFLAAALTLWADAEKLFPLWLGVLVFSPFIVDASYTLLRRLLRGEKVWQAHRQHLYQRLVGSGWSHRRTVIWSWLLMSAVAVSALLAQGSDDSRQWAVLGGWAVLYLLLVAGIEHYLEERK